MSALTEALEAFPAWMNRPHKRAQVYTWRLAVAMYGNGTAGLFRALPPYRNAMSLAQRAAVSAQVKEARRRGRVILPRYDERSGEYVQP